MLEVSRHTIRCWRDRWQSGIGKGRDPSSATESTLEERLSQLLADQPRPGTPPTFGPEVAVAIVALACRKPEEFGRPIRHWTSCA